MAAEGRIVREGVVAGVIGAAAVALLILIFDVASGAPLQTPAILGSGRPEGHCQGCPTSPRCRPAPCSATRSVHGLRFHRGRAHGRRSWWRAPSGSRRWSWRCSSSSRPSRSSSSRWGRGCGRCRSWACSPGGEIPGGKPGGLSHDALLLPPVRTPGLARGLIGGWGRSAQCGGGDRLAGFLGGSVVAVWFFSCTTRSACPAAPHARRSWAPRCLSGLRNCRAPDPAAGRRGGVHHLPLRRLPVGDHPVAAFLFAAEREPRILLGLPWFSSSASRCSSSGSSRRSTSCSPASSPGGDMAIGNLLA